MSYRLSSLGMGCALAALVWGGFLVCTAQAGGKERGRSIEFSRPKSDEVTTNLHQFSSKKESQKRLEEGFPSFLQPFSPPSSLDGVAESLPRPPIGSAIPSKRVKELLERRKNYIFMSPEDLVKGPPAEEIFKVSEYGPDGQEKKKLSPIEQYYHRQDAKRAADRKLSQAADDGFSGTSRKRNSRDDFAARNDSTARDDLDLPSSLRESEQALKKQFGSDAADAGLDTAPKRDMYSDIFGLGENAPSREDTLKLKRPMDDFSSINSFSDANRQPAFGAEGPNILTGSFGLTPRLSQSLPGIAGLPAEKRHDGLEPQLGTINPIFTPNAPLDVNVQSLGPSSLQPLTPRIELPRATTPTPTFAAPRRPF